MISAQFVQHKHPACLITSVLKADVEAATEGQAVVAVAAAAAAIAAAGCLRGRQKARCAS